MNEFLYLFRGGSAERLALSPDAMQDHLHKWQAWMAQLTQEGKMTGGLPLKGEGKVVRRNGVVTDGPYSEGKEIVGGYLTVRAADLNEASEIAKTCPTFEVGGHVEVREIVSMESRL